MQSSGKMKFKRLHEWEYGEPLWEGTLCVGAVEHKAVHPTHKSVGYLLVINGDGDATIFRVLTDAKCGPSLTRRVPKEVMMQFAKVILGEPVQRLNERPHGIKKYPVLANPDAPAVKEPEPEPETEETLTPFMDFV